MRKPRVILFDDEQAVLEMLGLYFEGRGYDVIACEEPFYCGVYAEASCRGRQPCGDLLLTDHRMPGVSGLELLRVQAERGCAIPPGNKALLSGYIEPEAVGVLAGLGCAHFEKPTRLRDLETWVGACEGRMDLSSPLAARRRERRQRCSVVAVLSGEPLLGPCPAEVTDRSRGGLCVRVGRQVVPEQVLRLESPVPLRSDRLIVRWIAPDDGGWRAGLSFG